MNKQNKWLKIGIFILSSVAVVLSFSHFLVSRSEIFYMSLPLLAGLYLFLFNIVYIRRLFHMKYLSKGILYIALIIISLWFFSKMIGGKLIWKELFLIFYFLTSIAIITFSLRKINSITANYLSKKSIMILGTSKSSFKIAQFIKITVSILLWLAIVFPYILATFSVHRPKIGNRYNPQSEFGLPYENITFRTSDHVLLSGWFVPSVRSYKSVIIGHGLGVNKSNFIELVSLWNKLGYNVLIFDFRGHGDSQGHTVSFGFREKEDIIAAVNYLCTRKDIDPNKIIGYGVSFGAVAMIRAAAEDSRIKVLIVDSPFAEVNTMANKILDRMYIVPNFVRKPLIEIGLAIASLDLGFNIRKCSSLKFIPGLRNQPVLIIHAKQDTLIPCTESEKLFKLAPEPKKLYLVDSNGHYSTLMDSNYTTVLNNFLREYAKF